LNYVRGEGVRFSTVLIDEAAQSMEPACLVPIVHGCETLILVGDQNQLPPVIASQVALERGLGVSLFSRLVTAGLSPALLDEQYRMHPSIAQFSSTLFYNGRVKSVVAAADRPLPGGFPWPNPTVPVVFIDVSPVHPSTTSSHSGRLYRLGGAGNSSTSALSGRRKLGGIEFRNRLEFANETLGASVPIGGGYEQLSNSSMASYYNEEEALEIEGIIYDFVEGGEVELGDIGVISPYSAQVRHLIDCFRDRGWVEAAGSGSTGAVNSLGGGGAVVEAEANFHRPVKWKKKKSATSFPRCDSN